MDYTDNADINHTLDENENIESSRKYEKKNFQVFAKNM